MSEQLFSIDEKHEDKIAKMLKVVVRRSICSFNYLENFLAKDNYFNNIIFLVSE